jgi:hypothetical protein
MRRTTMAAVVLGLAVALGTPMARGGGPLDPGAFPSLGTLNISGGSYTFNTTTDQLLDSSNNVLFTGVTFNGIAVFDFSQITIGGGTIGSTGSQPLALLSQGDIRSTGSSIYLNGGSYFSAYIAGPGGYNGGGPGGAGAGPGGGGAGYGGRVPLGGGGGGFGGRGGSGGSGGVNFPGGPPYGDLGTKLEGGSGGGAGSSGGGGGGAIELGAIGSITINGGTIQAEGSSPQNGGGGAGGGIFLHANSVSLIGSSSSDLLDVSGGYGGSLFGGSYAGGGGGGRILILANSYSASGPRLFNLAGGSGGSVPPGQGFGGVLTISIVPEPSSLVLLATALPAVAYALRRRAR